MGVTGLAGAGLTGKDGGEGAGFVARCVTGGEGREAFEGGLDGGEIVEGGETVGAAAEFAGSLGTAEHEEAKDGGLVAAEVKNGADAVLVLGDAGITDRRDESEILERVN